MNLNIDKKQLSNLSLVALSAIALGFAAAAIYLSNSASLPGKQIIPQTSSVSSPVSANDIQNIEECFKKSETEQQKCMDDFMVEYFKTGKTTKQVLADLETARSTNLTIENDCHPIVHAVGRETYKLTGNIGDAFEACDQTCHSGCYHGVMERLFYSDSELTTDYRHLTFADMEQKIPGICDKDKFKNPTNSVIFQCLHGVGHAIMYTLDYNLDDSLRSCDLFTTDYDRSSCYGGVVMENVTAFDKKKRDLKADDPLYPCSRLDRKYKSDCFLMQTSIMSEQGLSYEEMVTECRLAGDFENQCFVSMGRDLSNFVRTGDPDFVVEQCEVKAGENWESCLNGALYALIDNTWDLSFAYKLCDSLKVQDHVSSCFQNSDTYYTGSYSKTNEDIKNACRSFSTRNQDLCLRLTV
ncbi:MAG: hypothetical protein ACMG57_01240 [Candidatus Dojkabacteria bacterium]